MKKITSLNKAVEARDEEIEVMIAEMLAREEFACTGDACGGNACGVN